MNHVQELREGDLRRVGPYRLLGLLGGGGMGQVYLGAGHNGPVAIKIVHAWLATDEQFRVRFAREVAAGRRVRSPWTAEVVDASIDGDLPWLATEYVAGVPLDRAVRTAGPLPVASVHVLAADMARALVAIHAAGLVHRDVKPANVLLAADRPRLIDFGIARALDATQLTGTGVAIGTPAFMSPEQADGLETGTASDLFSLASVLVFAATGVGPFGDDTPLGAMRRIRTEEPDLGRLEEPVRTFAARCLRRNPADRPTAGELAEALQPRPPVPEHGWLPRAVTALIPASPRVATGQPTSPNHHPQPLAGATSVAPARAATRLTSRRRLLLGAGALGVVGVGAAIGIAQGLRDQDVVPPAPQGPPRVGAASLRWTFRANDLDDPVEALAVGAGALYAASGYEVHALDQTGGEVRWTRSVEQAVSQGMFVAEDVVVVATGFSLAGLDATTGTVRWSAAGEILAADNGIALARVSELTAGGSEDFLAAVETGSGATRWRRPIPPGARTGPVAFDAGRVHVGLDTVLATIDIASGAIVRELPLKARPEHLVLVGGVLCAHLFNGRAGSDEMVAVDAGSGAPLWRSATGQSWPPSVADRGLLLLRGVGSVEAWDTSTGERRWAIGPLHERPVPVPDTDWSLLAAAGGRCFVGGTSAVVADGRSVSQYYLHAYAADTGEVHWTFPVDPAPGHTAPLVAVPGTVFLGGGTGVVHAVADG